MTEIPTKAVTRIEVEGFRSLQSVELDLGRVTVLIGPNGAGKSNLLAFLQMVPLIHTESLQRFVQQRGGANALLHYGAKRTPRARFRLEFHQEAVDNAYEAELAYSAGDRLTLDNEYTFFRAMGAPAFTEQIVCTSAPESPLRKLAQEPGHPTFRTVSWWLSRMNFFHFHDTSMMSALRQNAAEAQDRFLRSEGNNLAAFLYRLKNSDSQEDKAAWKRINMMIRRIAPAVQELNPVAVNPGEARPRMVRLDWVDDQGETFGVHDLSDGTLRAIALVTALAQPSSTLPAFITIDEPELGLHPAALALFAGLVRSVSSRCQVVLATQSPALLDHFDAEDVVVAERVDGASRFRRLEREALGDWLNEYSLSQLFDKNVLGGRP
jgi:predicted ATPase